MKLSVAVRLLIASSLAVLIQHSVFAHTALTESTPASGAIVKEPPAKIDLVFNTPVRLIKLQLMGVGHEMPTNFAPNAETQATFSFESPGMHPGAFTVNWAVIGADGHTVTNTYNFVVDPSIAESSSAR